MIEWIIVIAAVIVQFTIFCRRRPPPVLTQFDLGKARHEPETYNPVLEAMLATSSSFNENLKTCLEMSIRDGISTQNSLETLPVSVAENGSEEERAYERVEGIDADFIVERSREKSKESMSAEGREKLRLKKLQDTQPDVVDYGTLEDPGEVKVKEMRSLRAGSLQHLLLQLSKAKAARLEKNKASGSESSSQEAKRLSKAQMQKAPSMGVPAAIIESSQVKASTLPTAKATFGGAKPMKVIYKSNIRRPALLQTEKAKDMKKKDAAVKGASAEAFAAPRRNGKKLTKRKAKKKKRK